MSPDFMDNIEKAANSLQSIAQIALKQKRQMAMLRLGTHTKESQNVVDTLIEV